MPGNAGLYLPKPGYLEFLREITKANGALLIFDEVMTGFRLAPGGAQERFGITPDLTCLGKIIGGGLPVGAFGGRADIMDWLAPLGPVYQAGTLSGNPLAMAAGIAALELLSEGRADTSPKNKIRSKVKASWNSALRKKCLPRLEQLGAQLEAGMKDAAKSAGVPVKFNRCGSMFCAYFTGQPVWNLADAMKSDRDAVQKVFPRDAGRRLLFGALAIRGGFYFHGAHARRTLKKRSSAAAKVLRGL